jgi:hypothetical protein
MQFSQLGRSPTGCIRWIGRWASVTGQLLVLTHAEGVLADRTCPSLTDRMKCAFLSLLWLPATFREA